MTDPIQPSLPQTSSVECIICHSEVPLSVVAAGSLYADGRQAFACNIHLRDRLRWMLAWMTFDADQQGTEDSGT